MRGVKSTDIEEVWPVVLPEIRRGLNGNPCDFTQEHVRECLKNRDMQLWIGDGYVLVTQIMNHEDGKTTCDVVVLSGYGMDRWLDDARLCLIKWCKSEGAEEIRVRGRKGWERALKPYGFKHGYTMLSLEV